MSNSKNCRIKSLMLNLKFSMLAFFLLIATNVEAKVSSDMVDLEGVSTSIRGDFTKEDLLPEVGRNQDLSQGGALAVKLSAAFDNTNSNWLYIVCAGCLQVKNVEPLLGENVECQLVIDEGEYYWQCFPLNGSFASIAVRTQSSLEVLVAVNEPVYLCFLPSGSDFSEYIKQGCLQKKKKKKRVAKIQNDRKKLLQLSADKSDSRDEYRRLYIHQLEGISPEEQKDIDEYLRLGDEDEGYSYLDCRVRFNAGILRGCLFLFEGGDCTIGPPENMPEGMDDALRSIISCNGGDSGSTVPEGGQSSQQSDADATGSAPSSTTDASGSGVRSGQKDGGKIKRNSEQPRGSDWVWNPVTGEYEPPSKKYKTDNTQKEQGEPAASQAGQPVSSEASNVADFSKKIEAQREKEKQEVNDFYQSMATNLNKAKSVSHSAAGQDQIRINYKTGASLATIGDFDGNHRTLTQAERLKESRQNLTRLTGNTPPLIPASYHTSRGVSLSNLMRFDGQQKPPEQIEGVKTYTDQRTGRSFAAVYDRIYDYGKYHAVYRGARETGFDKKESEVIAWGLAHVNRPEAETTAGLSDYSNLDPGEIKRQLCMADAACPPDAPSVHRSIQDPPNQPAPYVAGESEDSQRHHFTNNRRANSTSDQRGRTHTTLVYETTPFNRFPNRHDPLRQALPGEIAAVNENNRILRDRESTLERTLEEIRQVSRYLQPNHPNSELTRPGMEAVHAEQNRITNFNPRSSYRAPPLEAIAAQRVGVAVVPNINNAMVREWEQERALRRNQSELRRGEHQAEDYTRLMGNIDNIQRNNGLLNQPERVDHEHRERALERHRTAQAAEYQRVGVSAYVGRVHYDSDEERQIQDDRVRADERRARELAERLGALNTAPNDRHDG